MRKILILNFFLFSFSFTQAQWNPSIFKKPFPTVSGGHTIGSGGGIGELEMTGLWNRVSNSLKTCLNPYNYCQLDSREQLVLTQRLRQKEQCYADLVFKPMPSNQLSALGACKQPVQFNSALLNAPFLPAQINETLWPMALDALCKMGPDCTLQKNLFAKVLNTLRTVKDVTYLDQKSMVVVQRDGMYNRVFLRQISGITEMTQPILQRINCLQLNRLSIKDIYPASISTNQTKLNGQLEFDCGSKNQLLRNLMIELTNSNGNWIYNPSKVYVY